MKDKSFNRIDVPLISQPKGGGIVRGADENFHADAFTGTAAFSIPVPLPAARGTSPSLSVGYSSSAGNGLCGMGFHLAEDSVSIKTSRALPRYDETDVYMLNERELVPASKDISPASALFLERHQSTFDRIEKCTGTAGTFWKITHGDNSVSIYGETEESRVSDPQQPKRIFRWLISRHTDAAGNKIVYHYSKSPGSAAIYPVAVEYGNYVTGAGKEEFAFKVWIDYGQFAFSESDNTFRLHKQVKQSPVLRSDCFSNYRAGFLVKTEWLVRNIFVVHNFVNDEATGADCIVRRQKFEYADCDALNPVSRLKQVTEYGFIRTDENIYNSRSLPALVFEFTRFEDRQGQINFKPITDEQDTLINQPLQLVDFKRTGSPGILYRNAETLYYYESQGNGKYLKSTEAMVAPCRFADPAQPLSIVSLEGNSLLQIGLNEKQASGYYSQREDGQWDDFIAFPKALLDDIPNRSEWVDLCGSNRNDQLLITPGNIYVRNSLGIEGMEEAFRKIENAAGVEAPNSEIHDPFVHYGFANVFGDGLEHRIKLEDGKLTVWPNLGYGNFDNPIVIAIDKLDFRKDGIDLRNRFFPADVNGTGTSDIVILHADKISVYFNQNGSSFSAPFDYAFEKFLSWTNADRIQFVDVAGNGNTCIVISKNTPHVYNGNTIPNAHYYYEFNIANEANGKPFLLKSVSNNMGLATELHYRTSLNEYFDAQKNGSPWTTKLPFPVVVLKKSIVRDFISNTEYSSEYTYRNGYYDTDEHSFLGFGFVSHVDLPVSLSDDATPPPQLVKTWFHSGKGLNEPLTRKEFFAGDALAPSLPFHLLPSGENVTGEALYALAGSVLRTEVYDAGDLSCPYSASSDSYEAKLTQPASGKNYAVFRITPRESISLNYEKRSNDPHVNHSFVLEADAYNQPLKTCDVAYPRRIPLISEQSILYCTASESTLVNQDISGTARHVGVTLDEKSYEVHNLPAPRETYYSFDEICAFLLEKGRFANRIAYSDEIKSGTVQLRLTAWSKQAYWESGQQGEWQSAVLPEVLLSHHAQRVVFDETNAVVVFGDRKKEIDFADAGYFFADNYWWIKSPVTHFAGASQFYLPLQTRNDWAPKTSYRYTESKIEYDAYNLVPVKSGVRLDDLTVLSSNALMDYRTLTPWRVTDVNGNRSEVLTDELGIVIATAVYEKDGDTSGDLPLKKFVPQPVNDCADVLLNAPLKYIQQAGSFFHYEFAQYKNGAWTPAFNLSLSRTVYRTNNEGDIQRSVVYSDGFGRTIESRTWAGDNAQGKVQWMVSGRVTYNAKGQTARSYPGSFSGTYEHETEVEWKKRTDSGLLRPPATYIYDAAGRRVQVNTPKGFFSRVHILNAWETQHYDENDTVLDSPYYLSAKWKTVAEEKDAIEKAVKFYNTPSATVTDALGRQIIGVSDSGENKTGKIDWSRTELMKTDVDPCNPSLLVSWQQFDIQGRILLQADARLHEANQKLKAGERSYNFRYTHPIAGGMYRVESSDAGVYCTFSDANGNQLLGWDALGIFHRISYDNLQRPLSQYVKTPAGYAPVLDQVITKTLYGETLQDAAQKNMLGKSCVHFDSAGKAEVPYYTFDGHAEKHMARFRSDYKTEADWGKEETLEEETFITTQNFDAAGRPLRQTLPDASVMEWRYGAMGNCICSEISVAGAIKQKIVSESVLNEFGQLTRVKLGNKTVSDLSYDWLTMQLSGTQLTQESKTLQQLGYYHDPTGLITTMRNEVAGTQFFNNQQVNPVSNYTYDSLYRLVSAGGRMLAANNNVPQANRKTKDRSAQVRFSSSDLHAVENFSEQYLYDKSNNLLQLTRTCSNGFTRRFGIDVNCNRVNTYSQGEKKYQMKFNAAGYQLHVNGEGSSAMQWNSQGNIANVVMIAREGGNNDAEYYVYSSGLRVRKVTERVENGKIVCEDKRYLGDYKRTVKSSGKEFHSITVGGAQKHDCEVQYNSEAKEEIIFRFQHGNHLNSVGMETNLNGEIISYEEFSPFGETVYNYDPANLDSTKEYRYSAQEKDSSTQLYYYGYRYYAPWLCRWTRPDPAGSIDGFNLYAFVGNEPVGKVDVMGLAKKVGSAEHQFTGNESELSLSKQAMLKGIKDFYKKNGKGIEEFFAFTPSQSVSAYKNKIKRTNYPKGPAGEKLYNNAKKLAEQKAKHAKTIQGHYEKYNKLIDEFELSDKGGGQKENYENALNLMKSSNKYSVQQIFIEMKSVRTKTRYGHIVKDGMQGPHTNTRINVLELNEKKFSDLSKTSALNKNHVTTVYGSRILDDPGFSAIEGPASSNYKSAYFKLKNEYDKALNNGDWIRAIAYGQSLLDMHPYATSRSVASKSDLAGGGEGTGQKNVYKLFDYPKGDKYAGGVAQVTGMKGYVKDFVDDYSGTFGLTLPYGFDYTNK